jgi:hypothetical protein
LFISVTLSQKFRNRRGNPFPNFCPQRLSAIRRRFQQTKYVFAIQIFNILPVPGRKAKVPIHSLKEKVGELFRRLIDDLVEERLEE